MTEAGVAERIQGIIEHARLLKINDDLAIFHIAGGWQIMVGNPSGAVMLGESSGIVETNVHDDIHTALAEMELKLAAMLVPSPT